MQRFPHEVTDRICEFLTKWELQQVRIAAWTCFHSANRLLFDTVAISPYRSVFIEAAKVAARYGQYMTTLRYYAIEWRFYGFKHGEYEKAAEAHYKECLADPDKVGEREDIIVGHRDWAAPFKSLIEENEHFQKSGELHYRLERLMQCLPNLMHLIVATPGAFPEHDWENPKVIRYLGIRRTDICNNRNCRVTFRDHRICRIYLPEHMTGASNFLEDFLPALKHLKGGLKFISLAYSPRAIRRPWWQRSAFASKIKFRTLQQTKNSGAHLSGLRKLHLCFEKTDSFTDKSPSLYHTFRCLVNLEYLFLSMPKNWHKYSGYALPVEVVPDTTTILDGCYFPRLKSLVLEKIYTTHTTIVPFLVNHKTLEHVSLSKCHLIEGDWSDVADRMRGCVDFTTILIHKCSQQDTERMQQVICVLRDNAYTRFFMGKGPNPFLPKNQGNRHWHGFENFWFENRWGIPVPFSDYLSFENQWNMPKDLLRLHTWHKSHREDAKESEDCLARYARVGDRDQDCEELWIWNGALIEPYSSSSSSASADGSDGEGHSDREGHSGGEVQPIEEGQSVEEDQSGIPVKKDT